MIKRLNTLFFVFSMLLIGSITQLAAQETSADFSGGSMLVGDDNRACVAGLAGAMRYTGFEDITTGLVGHWKMDETSGTTAADSASGHTATFASSPSDPTWHASGKVDRALDFDGTDDYAETVSDADYSMTSFTLAAWVYIPTSLPTDYATILEHNRGGNNWFGMWKNPSGSSHSFQFRWANTAGPDFLSSSSVATTDTWIHVAGTFDTATTTGRIYVNGVLEGEVTNGDAPTATLDDIRIGYNQSSGEPWKGRLDDVRVYSRALTAAEINALPGMTTDITSNLQGHWKFDETSGTSTADSSANTNTGTLRDAFSTMNGPQWNSGGVINGAIEFESGADIDNVFLTYDSSLEIAGDMTVAGWVKTSETGYMDVLFQAAPPNNRNYDLNINAGKIRFGHGNNSSYPMYDSLVTVNDNVWHHVAFVADYPNGYFYVDGANVETVTMSFDITLSSTNNSYNFSNNNASWNYVGLMDDFRLYDRALTAGDINALPGVGGAVQFCNGTTWTDVGN